MIRKCPKCGSVAVRARRTGMIRAFSQSIKIYNYRCKSLECSWKKIVIPRSSKKKLRDSLLMTGGFVMAIGLTFQIFLYLLDKYGD